MSYTLLLCVCKYVASRYIIRFGIKDWPKMLTVPPDKLLAFPLILSPLAALLAFLFAQYNLQPGPSTYPIKSK